MGTLLTEIKNFITTESRFHPAYQTILERLNVPTSSGENVAKDVSYTINMNQIR